MKTFVRGTAGPGLYVRDEGPRTRAAAGLRCFCAAGIWTVFDSPPWPGGRAGLSARWLFFGRERLAPVVFCDACCGVICRHSSKKDLALTRSRLEGPVRNDEVPCLSFLSTP